MTSTKGKDAHRTKPFKITKRMKSEALTIAEMNKWFEALKGKHLLPNLNVENKRQAIVIKKHKRIYNTETGKIEKRAYFETKASRIWPGKDQTENTRYQMIFKEMLNKWGFPHSMRVNTNLLYNLLRDLFIFFLQYKQRYDEIKVEYDYVKPLFDVSKKEIDYYTKVLQQLYLMNYKIKKAINKFMNSRRNGEPKKEHYKMLVKLIDYTIIQHKDVFSDLEKTIFESEDLKKAIELIDKTI